jgi:hypothetical protein
LKKGDIIKITFKDGIAKTKIETVEKF